MSITLYEKTCGDLACEVRMDKGSKTYTAIIYYCGHTVYKNSFSSVENAKKAISREVYKNYYCSLGNAKKTLNRTFAEN